MTTDTVVTDASDDLRARVAQFARYLSAVRAQSSRPTRTLDSAELLVWQADLPAGAPGCRLGADAGDAWLRLERPPHPTPPELPDEVRMLLDGPTDDLAAEPRLRSDWRLIAESRDLDLNLDAVEPAVGEWLSNRWRRWAAEATGTAAARAAYARMGELRLTTARMEASHELVWGHGLIRATIGGREVDYPLLATPVAVAVNADTGVLTAVPTGDLRLQLDAFEDLPGAAVARLHELAGTGGAAEVDPWDRAGRQAFYRTVLDRLGLDPVILADPKDAEDGIRDTGVLMLRPRRTALPAFLADLQAALAERDGPAPVGALSLLVADEPSKVELPGDPPERWRAGDGRLLFPLPANPPQESIARRLAKHPLVAVQGPPGTGKTHTIANLLCHLVAHGRRVLVVAHREEPLAEVRDKLPAALQPLAVSVMGSSADQLAQLQIAVGRLRDTAIGLDQEAAARRIAEVRDALTSVEAELGHKRAALRTVALREGATFDLDGTPTAAADIAEWLRAEEGRLGFIPDAAGLATPFPLPPAELAELIELTNAFTPADRAEVDARLPVRAGFPDGDRLRRADEHSDALRERLGALTSSGLDVIAVRAVGRERAKALEEELWRLSYRVEALSPWLLRLAAQLAVSPAWRQTCQREIAACTEALSATARWRGAQAGRLVLVPEEFREDPAQLLSDLDTLRSRLVEGRTVNRLRHRRLSQIRDEVLVDDVPIQTVDDVDAAIATVRLAQERRRLRQRWNQFTADLGGPELPPEVLAEQAVAPYLHQVAEVGEIGSTLWPDLRDRLEPLLRTRLAGPGGWVEPGVLTKATVAAREIAVVFDYDDAEQESRRVRDALDDALGDSGAGREWRELDRAWATGDYDGWDAALAAADKRRDDAPRIRRWNELRLRLALGAPLWAGRLTAVSRLPDADTCLQAWTWRRAQTWLAGVIGSEDTTALGRQADALRVRIRDLTAELTIRSAWLMTAQGLDDRARDALGGWVTALQKVGKGTGRRAASWAALAQANLREAATSVPVWIMSVDRAVQQFSGGTTPFDVVIVDEASQCGLLSLPVLSLAKRAVIVGDDKQIGPYAVGTSVDAVAKLGAEHLDGIPAGALFDLTTSLYDHAVRRAPEPLLLTEHFRSVPEIITFSSDRWYGGAVRPLRADRGGLDPVRMMRVTGARTAVERIGEVNLPEADALVATACRLAADPRYLGKTFGVISLLAGSGQAQYISEQLVRKLGEQEMARRALKVGDAYTFQGAERDVMFLSLVVSADDPGRGAFTAAEHQRRVNVAASRARDQLWVFHSIDADGLGADDARGALLRYCATVGTADEPVVAAPDTVPNGVPAAAPAAVALPPSALPGDQAGPPSELEIAVRHRLVEAGLDPIPRFRLGDHTIDLVIPAPDGRRLAVECDDGRARSGAEWEDRLRRHAVLERVGRCVFWRVRGVLFNRDPEAALAGLWPLLTELRIPFGTGAEVAAPAPVADVPVPAPAPAEEPVAEGPQSMLPPVGRNGTPGPGATAEIPWIPAPEPAPRPSGVDSEPAPPGGRAGAQNRVAADPAGFRLVGWLAADEARALLAAYRSRTDIPLRDGAKVAGWACFYPEGSEESTMFGANVVLTRHRDISTETVGWFTADEALAIVRALEEETEVPVVGTGPAGRTDELLGTAQYVPADKAPADQPPGGGPRRPIRLLRIEG